VLTGEATTEPPIRNTMRMTKTVLDCYIHRFQVKNPL
jgi:hypothetical protein